MDLKIEFEDIRVTIAAADKDAAWRAIRAAGDAVQGVSKEEAASRVRIGDAASSSGKSKAARIREIARDILADGKEHKRREITAAVRAAGLDPNHIDSALKKYRRYRDDAGESCYGVPDRNRTPWPETPEPELGRELHPAKVLGTLNGGGHDD